MGSIYSEKIVMKDIKLDMKGKNRVKHEINEEEIGKVVTVLEYDDGTNLRITEQNESFILESNKLFEVQPDGVTVKVVEN